MIIITMKKATTLLQSLNFQNLNSLSRKITFLAFLGSFLLSFTAAASLTDGLVAHYEFSGDAQDSSGNGNHATVYGATLTTDRFANPDSAYAFNNAYIRTNNWSVGNMGAAATISLWINPDRILNATDSHQIIEKDNGPFWSIMFDAGRLWVYLRGSASLGPPEAWLSGPLISDLPTGWSSVVLRKNGGLFELFINGALVNSTSTGISSIIPNNNMSLGHAEYWHPQGIPQFYYGSIDSVRIYNRALSDAEVAVLGTRNPLNNGLVAYYPFNGNANDESVNANHGTVHGATLTTDRFGNSDSAYNFDGINNFISASANDLPTRDRTVSLWFYADTDAHPALLGYGGSGSCGTSYFMAMNAPLPIYQNRLYTSSHCDVNNLYYNYPAPPVGRWYHWVTTISGTEQTMYIDGVKVSTNNNFTSPTYVIGTQLAMGAATSTSGIAPYLDANVTYFNGKLDDVRIYDRVLTDAEIVALSASNPLNSGLVAYYPFSGNANDESVNDNDGVVYGAVLTTDRFGNPSSAFNFDGVDDYIDIGNMEYLSNDAFSVSIWVKKDTNNANFGFIGKWNTSPLTNNTFLLYNGEQSGVNFPVFVIQRNDGSYSSAISPFQIGTDDYYHLVGVFDKASGTSLYINAQLVDFNADASGIPLKNEIYGYTAKIGHWGLLRPGGYYFDGALDDIRIYNRALTDADVLALYNENPPDTVGDSLQLQSSYQFSLEQGTQSSFALDLANRDSVAHEATIEMLNPFDNLIVTHEPTTPTIVGPNTLLPITLSVDAANLQPGRYDVLLKVAGDDGSTIYSTVTIVVTDPGAVVTPDLSITARDMVFNPANPLAGETVTLSATVRNRGTTTSSATTVQFWDLATLLGEVTLDPIAANGVSVASLPVSFSSDGVRLIRVVVDPNGVVDELSEDNNEASQLLQIGASTGAAGNIIVTGSAPSNVVASQLFSVSGHAFYEIIVNGVALRDYVVKGGSVQITIEENTPGGQRWEYGEIHTNIYGDFSYLLQAPTALGEYKLTMTVTDQTFTGQAVLLFNVIEPTIPPPLPPTGTGGAGSGGGGGDGGTGSWTFNPGGGGGGGGGSWTWTWSEPPAVDPHNDVFVYSEDVVFSNNNPAVGEEIYIFANIHYWAESTTFVAENVPINFYVTFPGFEKMLIGSTVIDQLTVGAPDLGSQWVFASWRNTVGGIYIVEVEIDPSFIDSNPLNNAATRAIIVGDLDTGAIAGHVRDASGPVANVTLELQDLVGTVLTTTQTDNTGSYLFGGLVVGPRQVHIVAPDGYTPDAEIKGAEVVANAITTVDFLLSQQAAPVAHDQSVVTDEDVAVDITLTASDLDVDPLAFSIVDSPTHGILTGSAPNVTYTPDPDYYGTDSFTFHVTDGILESNIATVSITVNPVNDPPVAQADEYSTNEDTALIIAAPGVLGNDTDIDMDTLSASLVQGPSNGTLTFNSDGSFTYLPAVNFFGTDSFIYEADDAAGGTSNATVTIVVNPINDPPVAQADDYSTDEDTPLNIPVPGVLGNDTDVDDLTLVAQLVQGPAHGSLTLNSDGSFNYVPVANFNGTDSFRYNAVDSSGATSAADVTIVVNPINDPPVAQADSYATNEDVPLIIAAPGVLVNDSDVDGDTLTATIVQGPVNGTLEFNSDGSFAYIPIANYYGTDSFEYQASDPLGASSIAMATIVVHPVIDPPIAADDFYSTQEDTILNVAVPGVLNNDIDLEGGPLTAQHVLGPSAGSLIFHNDGSFTYEPAANFTGTDSFTYTATSATGLTASATVTIEVTPVNDDPVVILGDGAVIDEGDTYTSNGLFIDPDASDSWAATVDYGDGSGVQPLTLTDFEFALNHTYADNGLYTVTVTVSDVMGSGSAQLAVQVNNVAPDVGPITAPIDPVGENTPINVSADFTDPGILDTHTAVWDWGDGTTSPGGVSEINGSGSVVGDHAYTAPGVYIIILTVTDKDGDSGTSRYEFMVVHQVNSGFVTGGGWIDSPPGAYLADPTATGKANFGFNAKYKKGANVPDGSTEFQFKAGNLNFHSNSYDWLVVAGARAQYKGEGTINGAGVYGFLLTVIDGQINGGGGTDKFRMKIWDKASEVVIYDNQLGDTDDSQLATQLGGGQIVIHSQ